MSQKVRKTLIMIVMAALIICLMAASLTYTFTYGRYAGGKFDEESPYEDLIEFVGAREYTVRSPEELIQAIEDGYSNIKIADDAEEPFVITEGVTDVTANLVLNLNGKVVVRNSRNPMLDVQTNVSVVLVYDSKNTGAFYNPVGSSLMASGGSLTVGSGGYESGPRAKEFQGKESAGTLSPQPSDVAIFTRGGITSPDNVDRANPNQLSYQKIEASSGLVPKTTGRYYRETADSGYDLVPADTFLVYTIEEDCFICKDETSCGVTFTKDQLYVNAEKTEDGETTTVSASEFIPPVCDVASCDFYYYYPISGTPGTANSPQDYAVIYGYWDVMKLARDDKKNETDEKGMATALKDSGLIYPYGAVRMVEGEGIVRGGTFSNHFDAVNTYGIYAEGGTLSVSKNTTVDTTFTTGGEGVCIRVQSAEAEETTTTGEATTTGGSLTISGGVFSSEIGNTIEMSGGKMTVTAGTFTKDASAADTASTDNGSAIDIQGGKLSMTGSDAKTFTITGSHVNGIKSSGGGTVKAEHTTFSMSGGTDVVPEDGKTYGTDMFGINIGSGTVTANGCDITIYGTYSAGILSMGKNVNVSTVSVGAADNTASEIKVYVPESTKLLSSAGISSEGGKIQLTGNVNIETNGLGITARGPIDITGGEATVTTTHGTGIYVSGATITNTAKLTVKSNITSGWSWVKRPENPNEDVNTNVNNGIYVENGSIDASAGTLKVTHTGVAGDEPDNNSTTDAATKSYAVFVKGDAEGGSQETTVSIGAGTITGTKAGGVYVVGTSKQDGAQTTYTATVTLGGVNVIAQNTYAAGILTETGNVIIDGSASITSSALGIAVINGNVGISADSTDSSVTATRATGVYVQGGTVTNSGTLDVTSRISSTWENEGADFDNTSFKTSRFNGIFVNGGSLDSTGTLNVTFTGVQNDAPAADADGDSLFRTFAIKSYAVRVEAEEGTSATVTITSGKITNAVGGGVLVNGGTVHLGGYVDENGTAHISQNPVTVQTTGTGYHHNENNDADYRYRPDFSTADNWYYYLPSTGGPAVKVAGGTLTIYNGDYSAAQGDGIVTVNGMTTINDGRFRGNDNYNTQYENGQPIPQAGPGASYAFKVYGGTAEVYGGTFGGNINNVWSKTSGAFVMGTSDVRGTANIYGGTFEVGGGNNGNEGGQAGFSIYQYATVNFAPQDGKKILVNGRATAIAIEQTDGNSNSTVTISGGNFASTSKVLDNSDGIWYGNGSTTLNISSGTFTGAKRSGLWLDVRVPENGNVHLTGGTYYGNPVRSGSWPAYYWNNGGISAQSNGLIDGNGYWIGVNYIFDDGYKARCYYDDSYHDEYDDSALNQTTSRSERVDILQR